MAGRRQHHIPQLLQRRFGRRQGKKTTVVVHHADGRVFETSTTNFGVERDFYSPNSEDDADDIISKYEESLPALLDYLEAGGDITAEKSEALTALAAHLMVRTRFLRVKFGSATRETFEKFFDTLFQPEFLHGALQNFARENRDKLKSRAIVAGVQPCQARAFALLLPQIWPQIVSISDVSRASEPFISYASNVFEQLSDSAAAAQASLLLNAKNLTAIQDRFREWRFTVETPPALGFILPDTMISFLSKNGSSPISTKNDTNFIMSISSNYALVASRGVPRKIGGAAINKILAATSFQSFVASEPHPDLARLARRIGKRSLLIPSREIDQTVTQALESLNTVPSRQ